MRGKRCATAVFAALVCASLFAAAPAAALVKTVWPGDLIPERADLPHRQRQTALFVPPGGAAQNFYAPVKLPVGAVVTRMEVYYYGVNANANLYVSLSRQKLGAGSLSDVQDGLVAINPTGSTLLLLESMESTSIQNAKVLRDYQYVLAVEIRDTASTFYGAKIYYRRR